MYSFTICQCKDMFHVTERRRPFGDDVPLHCMGRSWSRWSTQSGGVSSSSHESYSPVKRKVYTCTLQVFPFTSFSFYTWTIHNHDIFRSLSYVYRCYFFFTNFLAYLCFVPSNKCTSFKQTKNLEIVIIMSSCFVVYKTLKVK